MEEIKANPLGEVPVPKLMVKFAVPSIIAMLVGALYNIIDQLFIGHAVGTLGNAATNIAFPLSTSCISLALMFGIGGASCFNLNIGKGNREKAPYFIGNSAVMLFLCGLVLAVVTRLFLPQLLALFGCDDDIFPFAQEYVSVTALGFPFFVLTAGGCHLVRADGSPGFSMACNIVGAVTNTVLDALFVLVLDMGMTGAAVATVIGQIISAVMVMVYLSRFKTVHLGKEHFRLKAEYISQVASLGIASFFNQLAMMIVQIVLNNSLRQYGAASEFGAAVPIAVAGIVMKVNQLVFSFVIGLGQGTQPIESFNYGAGKYGRVREAYRLAIIVGAAISVTAFIMFQLFPRQIIALFGDGSEGYFIFGESFFRIFLFFIWLTFAQPITTTFFTSIGKPVKGVFLSLTRQIIFFLPPLLVLPRIMGLDGILYTGPIADILSAVVTILLTAFEFRDMKSKENAVREAALSAQKQ